MIAAIDTDRLSLLPLHRDEKLIQEVFSIQSDPETWRHLPAGCEVEVAESARLVTDHQRSWETYGLGWWAVLLRHPLGDVPAGQVIGVGGCGIRNPSLPVWNLGYRFTPAVWGHGLASELSRTAIIYAGRTDPQTPITARVLSHNVASWHVLDNAGLTMLWEGSSPSSNNLTSGVKRRLYADRPLDQATLNQLIASG